jgi:hypothetical protein
VLSPGHGKLFSACSYVTDDSTGEAVAMALFGPGTELLVAVSDGRLLRFPVPERYREFGNETEP